MGCNGWVSIKTRGERITEGIKCSTSPACCFLMAGTTMWCVVGRKKSWVSPIHLVPLETYTAGRTTEAEGYTSLSCRMILCGWLCCCFFPRTFCRDSVKTRTDCTSIVNVPLFSYADLRCLCASLFSCGSVVNVPHFSHADLRCLCASLFSCGSVVNAPLFCCTLVVSVPLFFSVLRLWILPIFSLTSVVYEPRFSCQLTG